MGITSYNYVQQSKCGGIEMNVSDISRKKTHKNLDSHLYKDVHDEYPYKKNMDSYSYKDVHDENPYKNNMDSNSYKDVHDENP